MQIKTDHPQKQKAPQSLISQWLKITISIIAPAILLPYVFLLLDWIYSQDAYLISAGTLLMIISIQGLLVIFIPLVTAWMMFQRVSTQLQTVSRLLAVLAEQPEKKIFVGDEWVSIEKQENTLGQTARQIRQVINTKPVPASYSAEDSQLWDQDKKPIQDPMQTLFVMSFQESETQCYSSLY